MVSMSRMISLENGKGTETHIIKLKMDGNCRPGVIPTWLEFQMDRQLFQPLLQINQYLLLTL